MNQSKSITARFRLVMATLGLALVTVLAACGDSNASAAGCEDEVVVGGETMKMTQNIQYDVGDSTYAVVNMGPREVDGGTVRGAQLTKNGVDQGDIFDCDVVDLGGMAHQARLESDGVVFEPVAG